MPTKIIRTSEHVGALATILLGRKLPLTVTWAQGASRTDAQNRLSQRWYTDIATQLGDQTHEEVRAECKLVFGVPILCAENEAFRVSWEETFGRLHHESALKAVRVMDLPVTRLMRVKQMNAYMDAVQRQYGPMVRLTDPEALKYENEFAASPEHVGEPQC